jgi:hypothetical protein
VVAAAMGMVSLTLVVPTLQMGGVMGKGGEI